MEIDSTTYEDLSLYNREEEFSIFHKLDFTRTTGGKDRLYYYFNHPYSDLSRIGETQQILRLILGLAEKWPASITNGTIMMIERFYESAIDDIPRGNSFMDAIFYQLFHKPDYSLLRFSVGHFADFVRGMRELIVLLDVDDCPPMLRSLLRRAERLLDHVAIQSMADVASGIKFRPMQVITYGHYVRERFKSQALELIDIYGRMDAWYSMAMAMRHYNMSFPEFVGQADPYIEARSLYHILLPAPVDYDIRLDRQKNFLFLTGANMAGKSTFIRAVGVAVFLAHLGMGVPAESFRLSPFDGVLSNINVMDNIAKGESYFFNEVQRIRDTLVKISDRKKWLVLIDELFKGTNVQDAMKCSTTVIKGLIRIPQSIFVLSTHLYEIGEELSVYPNICFKYFETGVKDDQLDFSYQLKDGISNDRLGFLILKREKVVEMLEKL
ncbi:MAG: DNA mismatch repair protein MutS [Bacteroidota bacterium]|nr:DNA mismatch repair protein MutS [Bacteroidota bacterium]MDP4215166.1 DNA mismatch repair protein MutS [Bacteroidota bacterium]MDP4252665.1 DNA mismatch repair protein MutS [Bacteroidota bacterium]MDP4256688.1 DNA mismatch repair protein MutS [Bacteroidota bacterium]